MKPARIAAGAGVALALALVFSAYLRADLVFTLANQLWACF